METPKPKKEPKKKKLKWPLFAAGALAAWTGWYALNREHSKPPDKSTGENPPSVIQQDAGVRHNQDEEISRELSIGIHEIAAFENGFWLREDLNALDEGPDEKGHVADPENFYPEMAVIWEHQAKVWLQSKREIGYQERANILRHAYRIQ